MARKITLGARVTLWNGDNTMISDDSEYSDPAGGGKGLSINPMPHFDQFCRTVERGFAIHTGSSDRLMMEFSIAEGKGEGFLPRISAKSGLSFRIPESCVVPSEFFLNYEPNSLYCTAELAVLDPTSNALEAYDFSSLDLSNEFNNGEFLPVIKLASMRGLQMIQESICLQLFRLDFPLLQKANRDLAHQVQTAVLGKFSRFVEGSNPWLKASHAEKIAQEYLDKHPPKSGSAKVANPVLAQQPSSEPPIKRPESPEESQGDYQFLQW